MTRLLAELSKRRSFSLEVDQRVEEQYNIAPWHQVDGDDEDGGGGDDGDDGPEIEGALKPSTSWSLQKGYQPFPIQRSGFAISISSTSMPLDWPTLSGLVWCATLWKG